MKISDLQPAVRLAKTRSDLLDLLGAAQGGHTTCSVAYQGDRFEADDLLSEEIFQNAIFKAVTAELSKIDKQLAALGVDNDLL